MTRKSERIILEVEQQSSRGRTRHRLEEISEAHYVLISGSASTTSEQAVPIQGLSVADIIRTTPALHRLGAGAHSIIVQPTYFYDLVSALKFSASASPLSEAPKWMTDDEAEEWLEEDEQILHDFTMPPGLRIDPFWVRINDHRITALRSATRTVTLVHDVNQDLAPLINDEYLTWGFYGESGGPCTFDGGAILGSCGSDALAFRQWGDYNPQTFVTFHPSRSAFAKEMTEWVRALEWELPFLRAAVGFPGLSDEEAEGIWSNGDIEGTFVEIHLASEVKDAIVRSLCRQSPTLRKAVYSLRHPRSRLGRVVYAWTRLLASDEWGASSWQIVDMAMTDQLDPPEPGTRAPSMGEILERRLQRADAQLNGWAEPVLIPESIATALKDLGEAPPSLEERERRLAEATAAHSRWNEAVPAARELLRIDDSVKGSALWRAYEVRSAEEPEHEAAFLDAYHLLHNPMLPDVEPLRKRVDESRARVEELRAAGWPDGWDGRLLSIWKRAGGTMESARAWAERGWSALTVLGAAQLELPWNAPVGTRIKLLSPPPAPSPKTE